MTSHLTPALSPKGGEGVGKRSAVLAHRDREGGWLVTMASETFFKLLNSELPTNPARTE